MSIMMSGLPLLVEVFWKSSVMLGAALCLNALLRSKSADLRRLVLSAAIVALFVAALASSALAHTRGISVFTAAATALREIDDAAVAKRDGHRRYRGRVER